MQAPAAGRRAQASVWPTLVGLALAAAGVGFAGYVYGVPYQRLLTELKRRASELRAAGTAAEAGRKEVERLKQDLAEVRGARNMSLGAEGRIRSDLKLIKTQVEQRLPAGVAVVLEPRRMLIRFHEDAVFEARGPRLAKTGHEALTTLAEILADKASRLLIAAPMGGASPPRWVRAQFPSDADLSAARAVAALTALANAGVQAEAALAVVGSLAAPKNPDAPATLDIEVEPKE